MTAISEKTKKSLANLPDNWNGYNERKTTAEALAVLEHVHVVPTSEGGWQLELSDTDGDWEIEIEISPDGKFRGLVIDDNSFEKRVRANDALTKRINNASPVSDLVDVDLDELP